jgi:hypothetical protein
MILFKMRIIAIIFLSSFVFLTTIPAVANDIAIEGTAESKYKKEAVELAYFEAFREVLKAMFADQASDEIGSRFKDKMQQDFDEFKSRYFSSDSTSRCIKSNDRFRCTAYVSVKGGAVRVDFKNIMAEMIGGTVDTQAFILVASESVSSNSNARYISKKLQGAFSKFGHEFFSEGAEIEKLTEGKIDHSLVLENVIFSTYKFSRSRGKMSSTVRVEFSVQDLKRKALLKRGDFTQTVSVYGGDDDGTQMLLVDKMGKTAANRLAKIVNQAVVDHLQTLSSKKKAVSRKKSGGKLYTVFMRNLSMKGGDRKTFKIIRDAIKGEVGTRPKCKKSGGENTKCTFEVSNGFDPDGLTDLFYDSLSNNNAFEADYDARFRKYTLDF